MKRAMTMAAVAAVVMSATAWTALAGEIGFIEDFSLAKDRSVALKQLIPGTEEYYYFNCLHLQNTGQFDQVPDLLKVWIQRHGRTGGVIEIENRQALLTYDKNPQAALAFIQNRLGLFFNHQQEVLNAKPNLPTRLDPKLIGREALTAQALALHNNSVDGFEPAAYDWLLMTNLSGERRRNLLSRLTRPDYPDLVKLVVDDLSFQYSGGFGSLPIHGQMLLAQFDELLKLKPELLNQANFVNAYLAKLQPGPDVDWRHEPKECTAYLDRLWAFASRLAPAHNSLKAHVLYHRLVLDRSQGIYDKERFMTYLALPRPVGYVNPKYMEQQPSRQFPVNLNADYHAQTLLTPVGDDEPLVRSYLMNFFVAEDSYKAYEAYIQDNYLKVAFAETKIVNGVGDMEKWYSMLTPEYYQQFKERVDIDFAYTNRNYYAPDEPVGLDVYVKNAKSLIVKVYEVNALNFYRANLREVDTDINLDGLVANQEKVYEYKDIPQLRSRQHFDFAALKARGVYVVEIIGNGKASRALVRKGRLRTTVRTGTAGQVFTVLDENNVKLPQASLWIAGHEYKADKDGLINVPFTHSAINQPLVIINGDFATLDNFSHETEEYTLSAGMYVDREALLKRKTATAVFRPALSIHGAPVTLALLEEVRLVITSTDMEKVQTTKEVADFKLYDDKESTYQFTVPENLRKINFTIKAKVQNLSQNKKIDLAVGQGFDLNRIDDTVVVQDHHLRHVEGQYILDVLGKTGEALPDRAVNLELKHRDFRDIVHVSLQSDAKGQVALGELLQKDIEWVRVAAAGRPDQPSAWSWTLPRDRHSYPGNIQGKAGEGVVLPYMGKADKALRDKLSLLETRGGTFVADWFNSLKVADGMLTLTDLPAGDYSLLLKEINQTITVRLAPGEKRDGYVLSANRLLQVVNPNPLQIVSVSADKDAVKIKLANAGKFARVHLAATRYLQAYPIFQQLGGLSFPEGGIVATPKPETVYLAGRDIGDEYRYIIDRKYAPKFAGNMLNRPGLLLNPWAIRKTETGAQEAAAGAMASSLGGGGIGPKSRFFGVGGASAWTGIYSNLDFLGEPAVVMVNLVPDKDGVVTIARKDLGAHQQIHVLAADAANTVYRELALADVEMPFNDLRLAKNLDTDKHFTERKQIDLQKKGDTFVLPDITTSKFELYDSLPKVYALYATLSHNSDLAEFSFILEWPKLKADQKREKYSKYACHELSFFLSKKDPEFFEKVIAPYLKNKKDKTFMDRYLLGEELTGYLKPWAFEQLNVVERALLAQRVATQQPAMARHVKDLYDLIPPDIERFNYLFKTALKGSALEAGDTLGLKDALSRAQPARMLALKGHGEYALDAAKAPAEGRDEADSLTTVTNGPVPAATAAAAPAPAPAREPEARPAGAPAKPQAEALYTKSGVMDEKSAQNQGRKFDKAMVTNELAKSEEKLAEKAEAENASAPSFDLQRRKQVRQYFRRLDKTEEWAENNYYHLPIEAQTGGLIKVNGFWKDYAAFDGKGEFRSPNLAEASGSFAEMLCALSVLDLPFDAPKNDTQFKAAEMTLTAGGPVVIFHRQIQQVLPQAAGEKTPILVSENFFRESDRYRFVNNERFDKYVTDEFLIGVVYGCQVVITNPTSSPQKLDVLLQVPRGSLPAKASQYTRSLHIDLQPYAAQTAEYCFYFPGVGEFPHYPVHVAKNEALIAFAAPTTLKAVAQLTNIDKTSWDWISQYGSDQDVIDFLKAANIDRLNLDKIAWRMKNVEYFNTVVALLTARHVYHNTLWSYSVKHNAPAAIREFLQHADGFVAQCGLWLDSPLLSIDPVIRHSYQHLEYSPLVNARAHKLGKLRQILNDRFYGQHQRLMKVLSYRPKLDDEDLLAVSYYMLLQDRIEDAFTYFNQVGGAAPQAAAAPAAASPATAVAGALPSLPAGAPSKLASNALLQYDYMKSYLAFFTGQTQLARDLAAKYKDYPVDRWRKLFENVLAQLDEAEGKGAKVVDDKDRTQEQTALAATAPALDLSVEAKKVLVKYQNIGEIRVNYYLMDVELLFSSNPFVQQYSGQFAFIRPNASDVIKLPAEGATFAFDLPAKYHAANVMVEVEAAGQKKSQAYYANSLAVQTIANYGQVKVSHEKTGAPLAKVYVKVYARNKDGQVKFYKDGYTDLRGRFDYASLNTNELENVDKFSILVLSETDGAVVREAPPPKQ